MDSRTLLALLIERVGRISDTDAIWLDVKHDNHRAGDLYLSCGFLPCAPPPDPQLDPGLTYLARQIHR